VCLIWRGLCEGGCKYMQSNIMRVDLVWRVWASAVAGVIMHYYVTGLVRALRTPLLSM